MQKLRAVTISHFVVTVGPPPAICHGHVVLRCAYTVKLLNEIGFVSQSRPQLLRPNGPNVPCDASVGHALPSRIRVHVALTQARRCVFFGETSLE
jgi:hypothetical protein